MEGLMRRGGPKGEYVRLFVAAFLVLLTIPARAEDGYDLWLRYRPMEASALAQYRPLATGVVSQGTSPSLNVARAELLRGLSGLLQKPISTGTVGNGAIVIGTPVSSPLISGLKLPLTSLGDEGYLIRSAAVDGHAVTVIAANSDIGVLYGSFALLRLIQTRQPIAHLDIASAPKLKLRILNHWDNLDGTIERGYAGHSIFDWHKMPDYMDQRYTIMARADASVGINGISLNNVSADVWMLAPLYLNKVAALADVLRPYGVRIYLSIKFSAPVELGKLKTADPADRQVRAWWKKEVDGIYRGIPDFGGFVVKANSEGQPGPRDYNRSQADGANVIADALKPHGGTVFWRAFVYSEKDSTDRAKQAYNEFKPLDGQFRDNVFVQTKNGAIDFQPREPAHPMFGAMPKTNLALEVQLTKEYLGQATHLVYLPVLWKEVLDWDTMAKGKGSTVARVIDGSLEGHADSAMVGVANIGDDRNWTGAQFSQADWYGFGRMTWDLKLTPKQIAREWLGMTFTSNPAFINKVVPMMMESREAVVNYMTPLGLHHMMATGHHYGPGPWVGDLPRPEQNPIYFHRADAMGVGFDRTPGGSDATSQYAPPIATLFAGPDIPDRYLLWFHHVAWDHRMKSGRTLWDEFVLHYDQGIATVHQMRETWGAVKPYVDAERWSQEVAFLGIQEKEAQWWRDACLAYFETFSHMPMPAGHASPPHDLAYYEAIYLPYAPGRPGYTAAPFRNTPKDPDENGIATQIP
ncbi:MAG TPA: alpha-glucuronidase family glycosyl hydrolase [Rhizomicrobium sp.]|nr:alpha-glucuronidase family glycosyl hydrolase [Rhizomicrobium sp.]